MPDIAPAVFLRCNTITLRDSDMLEAVRPRAGDGSPTVLPRGLEGVELSVDREHFVSQATTSARAGMLAPIAAAFALHLAAGLAMLGFSEAQVGNGGIDLDAVSIEVSMMPASALDSRKSVEVQAVASAGSMDIVDGAPAGPPAQAAAEAAAPDVSEVERSPAPQAAVMQTQRGLREQPSVDEPPPARPSDVDVPADKGPVDEEAIVLPERVEPPTEPPESAPEPQKSEVTEEPPGSAVTKPIAAPQPPARPAQAAGGAAASQPAAPDQRATPAAAAARPGAINAFHRSIVAALAEKRPTKLRTQRKGTVKIAFAVAEDGRLAFARIARSSGHRALDDAALAAITSAKFPVPPAGLTLKQRTYEVPYHFK